VVDVGANIGAYAVWAAGRMGSGRLIAIEPNPVSFERLQHSIRQLPVETSAYEVACGDSDGEIALYFEPGYTVSSSVVSFTGASETATVRVRRLDDILANEGITHVDLLKIDVEGAEAMVLRGASTILGATARVILETVEGDLENAVTGMLLPLGFRLGYKSDDHWGIGGLRLLAFERA
jgi:FkbM family methyltransferase